MNVTCPSCGAEMDLDVLLAHEDSRRAMARLAEISLPLGKLVLQYLRLFKPSTRQMGHSRVVRLIEELLPDLQRQAITHNGRDWDAGRDTWQLAIERVLEMRDNGKLTLPLKSHGYLYQVLAGMANQLEADQERRDEAARRGRAHQGGLVSVIDVVVPTGAPDPSLTANLPPIVMPDYSKPSRAAQEMKARLRRTEGDTQ